MINAPSQEINHRIETIDLQHQGVVRFSPAVEREKVMALEDLVRTGTFAPLKSGDGPYRVNISMESADRMILSVTDKQDACIDYHLALQPLKGMIKDYFVMCDALQDSLGKANADRIEAIDMARRSIHDEAAEEIISQLKEQISVCLDTSRRIFTLACVLHAY